jgi:hypothetical protein
MKLHFRNQNKKNFVEQEVNVLVDVAAFDVGERPKIRLCVELVPCQIAYRLLST